MTSVGNLLEDSNLRDHLHASEVREVNFVLLRTHNPQARYLTIGQSTGEIQTLIR